MLAPLTLPALLIAASFPLPPPGVQSLVTETATAQPAPDPSWGEEEVAGPTDDTTDPAGGTEEPTDVEAQAEAPDPLETSAEETALAPTYPVQPTEPTGPADPGELKIPDDKGLGLMITSGALGAAAWGVMAWRIARIRRLCQADDIDATTVDDDTIGDVTDDATDCFLSGRGGNAGLWVLQAVPNAVNWGIAPAAATIRAKYDAARFVKHGEADRKPNVFIGTGAALLGAGAIGRIVVMVIRIQSLEPEKGIALNCLDGAETEVSDFFSCYANKNAQLYAAHQITSAGVAGGAGLLAYGIVYKRERRNLEKKYDIEKQAQLEFRVEPQLSFNHTGVAATLRF